MSMRQLWHTVRRPNKLTMPPPPQFAFQAHRDCAPARPSGSRAAPVQSTHARCGLVRHCPPELLPSATAAPCADSLEQSQHGAHAANRVQRGDQRHLGGAGVGEANPGTRASTAVLSRLSAPFIAVRSVPSPNRAPPGARNRYRSADVPPYARGPAPR